MIATARFKQVEVKFRRIASTSWDRGRLARYVRQQDVGNCSEIRYESKEAITLRRLR
jgi:hypothetical protein